MIDNPAKNERGKAIRKRWRRTSATLFAETISEGSRCWGTSKGRTTSNIFGQQTFKHHGNRLYAVENGLSGGNSGDSGRKTVSVVW